jgi:DNA (cytosine-5)-methyltransferase 1
LVRLTDATGSGSWLTPRANDWKGGLKPGTKSTRAICDYFLPDKVNLWPTPTSRDHKDGSAQSCSNVPVNSLLGRPVHNGMSSVGSLNPAWVEFLMGLPTGWTVCELSATPSSRKSPKSSDGQS